MQLGNLVDFEVDGEDGRFMPRIRSLSHIGFPWLFDKNKLLLWHNFIRLFEPHLKDAQEVERFYFDLLLNAAKKWHRQNPKRIICESYMQLLEYEGRIHDEEICYICEQPTSAYVSLMRSLIPAHPECVFSASLKKEKVFGFFESKKSVFLEDEEVSYLYDIIMKGF